MSEPTFGTYQLSQRREKWREKACAHKDTLFGRALISLFRKMALRGQSEPLDVVIDTHIKARVYPSENRTDKRVFAGPQIWETVERAALKDAIIRSGDRDFVFVDVGANSGFYALYVHKYAKELVRNARIVAIEPSHEMAKRLAFNCKASSADIEIAEVAVSDTPREAVLERTSSNRGEAKLSTQNTQDKSEPHDEAQSQEIVVVDTLYRICEAHNIDYIDALKMDIEGHEIEALRGLFNDAPLALHPRMLIVETRFKESATPLLELCQAHDYVIKETTRQNTILVK